MSFDRTETAVVFIDPQVDVLSKNGKNWSAVGASVTENKTVENMLRIFKAAKSAKFNVFISPHYFFPTDRVWKFNGPLEAEEFATCTFARSGQLSLEGFEGSGAHWLDEFKPYINDGETVVLSPHKVFGPQTNDLVIQLRKRGVRRVVLGGMLAICAWNHICVICSNRASRFMLLAMRLPGRVILFGAMDIRRQWSTMRFSRTAW